MTKKIGLQVEDMATWKLFKNPFERAKEQGFPAYSDRDLICNVCGEPWNSYGVSSCEDMTALEKNKFMRGQGCPCCRDKKEG